MKTITFTVRSYNATLTSLQLVYRFGPVSAGQPLEEQREEHIVPNQRPLKQHFEGIRKPNLIPAGSHWPLVILILYGRA